MNKLTVPTILIALALTGCEAATTTIESRQATDAETAEVTASTEASGSLESGQVGDTATTDTMSFTLDSIEVLTVNGFGGPVPEGMRLIAFNATVSATEPEMISSLLMFEARDPNGATLDRDLFVTGLDGNVAPNLPLSGKVAFLVPVDVTEVVLVVNLDVFGTPAIFQVQV